MTLTLVYLLASFRRPADAPANPWHSRGFEWLTATPPPEHDFVDVPDYTHRDPHDYWRRDVEEVADG